MQPSTCTQNFSKLIFGQTVKQYLTELKFIYLNIFNSAIKKTPQFRLFNYRPMKRSYYVSTISTNLHIITINRKREYTKDKLKIHSNIR